MAYWWTEKAIELQYKTRTDEDDINQDYEEHHVRRATVHTREDMILLASYLHSANKQLRTISRLCFCILLVLIVIAVNT
jgi:hypothetical protein